MLNINRNKTFFLFPVMLALQVLSMTGCSGDSGGPGLARATGIVTMNGQPLPQIKVLFEPQSNDGPSWGSTDGEGRFEVYYTAKKPGAVLGKHRVQFGTGVDDENSSGPPAAIAKKYAFGSPGIEVEVIQGPNEFEFDLGK